MNKNKIKQQDKEDRELDLEQQALPEYEDDGEEYVAVFYNCCGSVLVMLQLFIWGHAIYALAFEYFPLQYGWYTFGHIAFSIISTISILLACRSLFFGHYYNSHAQKYPELVKELQKIDKSEVERWCLPCKIKKHRDIHHCQICNRQLEAKYKIKGKDKYNCLKLLKIVFCCRWSESEMKKDFMESWRYIQQSDSLWRIFYPKFAGYDAMKFIDYARDEQIEENQTYKKPSQTKSLNDQEHFINTEDNASDKVSIDIEDNQKQEQQQQNSKKSRFQENKSISGSEEEEDEDEDSESGSQEEEDEEEEEEEDEEEYEDGESGSDEEMEELADNGEQMKEPLY